MLVLEALPVSMHVQSLPRYSLLFHAVVVAFQNLGDLDFHSGAHKAPRKLPKISACCNRETHMRDQADDIGTRKTGNHEMLYPHNPLAIVPLIVHNTPSRRRASSYDAAPAGGEDPISAN